MNAAKAPRHAYGKYQLHLKNVGFLGITLNVISLKV